MGNVLANLRQIGSGNDFYALQSGTANRIGEMPPPDGSLPIGGVVQEGTDNRASATADGSANLIEYIQQYGAANAARLLLSGERNVVSQIYQNDEGWSTGALGNRITLTITGSDNGGSGSGWVGEMIETPALGLPGIAQGVLLQLGDDNDISFAILAGISSKYGFSQVGDSNDIHVAIEGAAPGEDAIANETAVFQKGDTNYASIIVSGSNNAAALREEGDRNRIALTQTGAFNVATIAIRGDDNNTGPASLFGPAALLAASFAEFDLAPGAIAQTGLGPSRGAANAIGLEVNGAANAFSLYQRGAANSITGSIGGDGNALAVVQLNAGNSALVAQPGSGNSFALRQF